MLYIKELLPKLFFNIFLLSKVIFIDFSETEKNTMFFFMFYNSCYTNKLKPFRRIKKLKKKNSKLYAFNLNKSAYICTHF
ncbi:MAG: hypothetical protein DRJ09_03335 [Bacteroidetes bacterium]|nr:MAG: hypothetical protein DRJ09_03335 [Bacteroidota bacterium]